MNLKLASTIIVLGTLSSLPIQAGLLSGEAFDNATVQAAGPRSGTSGKNFFNVEGAGSGSFASYGVADFLFDSVPDTVLGITSFSISFTQSNAAFTHDGQLVFSLDISSTLADIQPVTSPLAFDAANPGTATDVNQGDLSLLTLGTGTFTKVANGTVDTFSLSLTPQAQSALVTKLNNNDTIRVVIGTGDDTVAATYAGFSNATVDGPTLAIMYTPVPEPATTALFTALGCLGLVAFRRATRK
jgi:hypothetical protein